MKKHIPSVKHRVNVQAHTTNACSCGQLSDSGAIEDLRKQMLKLQSLMSALLSKDSTSAKSKNQLKAQKPKPGQTHSRPKPWFCFKCGQDGHIAPNCSSQPNSSLVEEKHRQLKHKQQSWEKTKPSNQKQFLLRDKWELQPMNVPTPKTHLHISHCLNGQWAQKVLVR